MSKEDSSVITLDDIGRRYDHLSDLLYVWENALLVVQDIDSKYLSDNQEKLIDGLKYAIKMLKVHIDQLAQYKLNKGEAAVNSIPSDPSQIKGGRGTPLKGKK